MGIEPTSEAWEASIKRQKRSNWRHFDVFQVSQLDSNWSGRRLSALDDLKPETFLQCSGSTIQIRALLLRENGRHLPRLKIDNGDVFYAVTIQICCGYTIRAGSQRKREDPVCRCEQPK